MMVVTRARARYASPLRGIMQRTSLYIVVFLLGVFCLVAFLPGLVTSQSPRTQDAAAILQAPNAAHPAGTDGLGRDMLARLFEATRVSFTVCALAILITLVAGIGIGLLAGLGPF